jgi:hypothetical protein
MRHTTPYPTVHYPGSPRLARPEHARAHHGNLFIILVIEVQQIWLDFFKLKPERIC